MKTFSPSTFVCILYLEKNNGIGEARLVFDDKGKEISKLPLVAAAERRPEVRPDEVAGVASKKATAVGEIAGRRVDQVDPKARRVEAKKVLAEAAKIPLRETKSMAEASKNPYSETMPAHVKLFVREHAKGSSERGAVGYDPKTWEPKLIYPPTIGVVTVAKTPIQLDDGRVFFAVRGKKEPVIGRLIEAIPFPNQRYAICEVQLPDGTTVNLAVVNVTFDQNGKPRFQKADDKAVATYMDQRKKSANA